MAHDIFISYSSEDENVVRAVSNALEAEKIRCWYASRDIPAGEVFAHSIINALQEAKALLLIFTDFSNASQMVLNEVNIAISLGKPVIPFKLTSNNPTGGMKFYLDSVHWLDAVDQPLEEAIEKLVERIKRFVDVEEDLPPETEKSNTESKTKQGQESGRKLPTNESEKKAGGGKKPFPLWIGLVGLLVVALLVFGAVKLWSGPKAPANPWENNVLMADVLTTPGKDAEAEQSAAADGKVFNTAVKRAEVETVTFLDSLKDAPKTARDLSAAVDGSVLGWSAKNSSGTYDLYIAGEGGVLAPEDCTGLFQGYENLKTIDFGTAFHTDATTNMRQMFTYCPNLASLDLSGFDTARVTDMSRMLACDTSLRKITFGERFVTSNVIKFYSMFFGCSSLEQLDVSGFDTAKAEKIDRMFYSCSKLESIDVSGFETKNVTDMSYMFNGCSALKALDMSGFNTENVTTMRAMFQKCSSLSSLDVSGFDTKNVTDMSYMFIGCSGLTSLDVSGFDMAKVTQYESFMPNSLNPDWEKLFSNDGGRQIESGEKQINASKIPVLTEDIFETHGEKDEAASIGAFTTGLKRSEIESISFLASLANMPNNAVDLSKNGDGSVMAWTNKNANGLYDLYIAGEGGVYAPSDSTGLFNGYINLKSIDFGGNFHTENAERFYQLFFCCPKLTALDLSGFDTAKVTDMSGMFCHDSELKEIVFGSTFSTAKVIKMTSMFYGCENLTELDVSGFNTENCESMHAMFCSCGKLNALDVSHFNTGRVKFMSSMFSGCSSLTELDVSHFDTSRVTNMSSMFSGCSSLTELDVSHFDTSRVTNMSSMFSKCDRLTGLELKNFDTSRVTDMNHMFSYCDSLTSLDVRSFNTSRVTSMYAMFYKCGGLKTLDVSSFDTSRVTDMSYMFNSCDGLTSLDLSGFDTSSVTQYDYFMPDYLDPNWHELFKQG